MADRAAVGADRALAVEHVHQGVVVLVPRQAGPRTGGHRRVQHGDRRVGDAGALVPVELTGDDAHQRAAVGAGEQRDVAAADVLVARGRHLHRLRQVDPQLEAVEEPTGDHERLRRHLDVQQAGARRHPLGVAVADRAATTVGVLVHEGAVDDVGDGLEAAVGVPRGALGLARRVLDLTHLVHVDERVERGEVDAGEGTTHRETLALEARRCGRHRAHRARHGLGDGLGDLRQGQDVVDGHGRHGDQLLRGGPILRRGR